MELNLQKGSVYCIFLQICNQYYGMIWVYSFEKKPEYR
jgi:hypothetical protein